MQLPYHHGRGMPNTQVVTFNEHLRFGLHGYNSILSKKLPTICGDLRRNFVDVFDFSTAYVLDEQLQSIGVCSDVGFFWGTSQIDKYSFICDSQGILCQLGRFPETSQKIQQKEKGRQQQAEAGSQSLFQRTA